MASNTTAKFASPPPPTPTYILTFPAPHVLLLTINRPRAMNSLSFASQWEADSLFQWFDSEPTLRVAVVTGTGRAFCAGQDLIEQRDITVLRARQAQGEDTGDKLDRRLLTHPPNGFMGLSRRVGKKPIIAAVNGHALGGGFEICLGCDMIVASPRATFGLPEAARGLYAAAGGLSRLVRQAGMTVASEIAMMGRILTAPEAVQHGIANRVSKTHESLVDEAVDMASRIASLSPDAIIVTRAGLRQSWEDGSVERATQITELEYGPRLRNGRNLAIGLRAFAEKKVPVWEPSKL
ncbi:ClpP/crotonase [Dissoconium aciculare CBS 342.82]|uniref:ClpP/crotonase n=1 Tax=Dissoconium aciculare CBS 342.82 TaxID=1314786 RepID=A0A6J3LR19_9PEZI|nr:ClpP/crotonase [Dissoconium aciculare CBS 342.82]KAF1818068.1 ClpP/crotonase [Dissoconium aciculare CBS 342.82]